MLEGNDSLVGRFFAGNGPEGKFTQGWVKRDLGSGFFQVEIYVDLGNEYATVGRIMHFVEMRTWEFYKDSAIAQRHYDSLMMQRLEDIDLAPICESAARELEDLVLEEIVRANSKHQESRVQELVELLSQMAR